jgi:hypothetical protein
MDTKHTPGPWYIASDIHDDRIGIGSEAGVVVLAPYRRHARELAGVQGLANARLIVAAPDMLQALRPFARFLDVTLTMGGTRPRTGALYQIESASAGSAEITVEHLQTAFAAIAKATGETR